MKILLCFEDVGLVSINKQFSFSSQDKKLFVTSIFIYFLRKIPELKKVKVFVLYEEVVKIHQS